MNLFVYFRRRWRASILWGAYQPRVVQYADAAFSLVVFFLMRYLNLINERDGLSIGLCLQIYQLIFSYS